MKYSKRDILRLGIAIPLGFGGGAACPPVGAGAAAGRPEAIRRLLGVLGERESAAIVGRRYLEGCPAEADMVWLLATIERRLRRATGLASLPPIERIDDARLTRYVTAAVSRDFEDDRMTAVEGWLLAETEARICALAALVAPRGTRRLIG